MGKYLLHPVAQQHQAKLSLQPQRLVPRYDTLRLRRATLALPLQTNITTASPEVRGTGEVLDYIGSERKSGESAI